MPETKQLPEKYIGGAARNGMNPEFVALWEAYLDEGYAIQHVAEVFGVHKHTVRRHYPGRGWTPEQTYAHRANLKQFNEKIRKMPYDLPTGSRAVQAVAS